MPNHILTAISLFAMIAGLGCSSLLPPLPTHTPYPTPTALPTYTPYPTTTAWPTHTPYPTATPLPTYTPYPTATRRPTPRPRPTYTRYPTSTPAPNVELPSGIFFAFYEWPRDDQMWHHTSENGVPCVALAYKEQDGLYYPYDGAWGCDFAGYFTGTITFMWMLEAAVDARKTFTRQFPFNCAQNPPIGANYLQMT